MGSEARGTALPGSDLDVAVLGPAKLDLAQLATIRADLDGLPTLRSFDLVDLRRTSDAFRREAMSSVIPLVPSTTSDVQSA